MKVRCLLMNIAQMMRAIEMVNWTPTREYLIALPLRVAANEPFSDRAGGTEVEYMAGYRLAMIATSTATPTVKATMSGLEPKLVVNGIRSAR